MQIKYENRNGPRKCQEQNHKKNTNLCNSCTHHRTFLTLPSFKMSKRCVKYGTVSTKCNFSNCKYHNTKTKFELIIGA